MLETALQIAANTVSFSKENSFSALWFDDAIVIFILVCNAVVMFD
jgi:hypothetical protein